MVALLAILIMLAIVIAFYAVDAYGIMKLMEVHGRTELIGAWIPFYNNYLLGEIVEEELEGNSLIIKDFTKWIFALAPFAGVVPVLGQLAVVAAAIYMIILCAMMAQKYNSIAPMIITSLIGLPGIGYMIVASVIKNSGVKPSEFAGGMDTTAPWAEKPQTVYTDFSVEAVDEKSEPEAAPAHKEPVYAKPQTVGTTVAVPDSKKNQAEPVVEEISAEPVIEEISAAPAEEVQEFDVPLAVEDDDSMIVEFEVEE